MANLASKDAAKLHVEEIRAKKFAIGKKEHNPLTEDLHHAVTSLSAELYTKDIHFLMELIQQNYIDIGECYAESYQVAGVETPEKDLLDFLVKHFRAKDLPDLPPPDMVLPLSSCLTSQQAFLLLDWIRVTRAMGLYIPRNFSQGIKDGRWMKAYSLVVA